ncbi:MAG: N-acetylglucosamine-6-phosphate deacetylase, partial [Kiritimatiellaeota bacterium]|nr:N-acetylglucosamine-6-phosphate deacetylase [Kiritimatiellota bacterium]
MIAKHGLVDLQVNGYAGVDFNTPGLSVEDVRRARRLLRDEGITAFLPTLITNDLVVIERLADTLLAADDDSSSGAEILGLHLEGPFISPHDGARGAHPAAWVRPPDAEWLKRFQDRCAGRVRLVTFSPEWDDAPRFVEVARALGIRVAIGHTLATRAQIRDAVAAGATLSTHLGNALPPLLPRHPNPIWSQLAEDDLAVSLVGDGFHLPREFIETVLKVKGENAFLVSDCTRFAGMAPGRYTTPIGGDVVLTPEGRLHLAADERLL